MNNEGTFAEYLTQYLKDSDDDTSIEEQVDDKSTFNPRSISRTISARTDSKTNDSKLFKRSVSHGSGSADLKKSKKWQLVQRSISIKSNGSTMTDIIDEIIANKKKVGAKNQNEDEEEAGRLIEEEEAQSGTVKYGVYLHYFRAFGWLPLCVVVGFNIIEQVCGALARVWLSDWSEFNDQNNGTEIADNLTYYLGKVEYELLGYYAGLDYPVYQSSTKPA